MIDLSIKKESESLKIRAIFIDMDGTLLTASNAISRRNQKAIEKLMEQGIKVFLATGRHYEITVPYHQQLGLHTPMICLNGAAIYDGTGKVKYKKTIHLNEERFHELTADSPYNVLIHTTKGLYCKELNEEIEDWIEVGQVPPLYVGDLRQTNIEQILMYGVYTGTPDPTLFSIMKKEFQQDANIIDWVDGFELVAPQTSKWSAIQKLLTEYEIHPKEIVAIGDGPNDFEMLRHAGIGVAMANASKKVKAAAKFVTDHHELDGLAQFIERFLLQSNDSYAI